MNETEDEEALARLRQARYTPGEIVRFCQLRQAEELLAAAHAGCYAMALAFTLAEGGTPPERLRVSAVCTHEEVEQKPKITAMELEVTGEIAGVDAAGFEQAVQQAEQLCPVSNALRQNVAIRLTTHLEA